MTWIKATSREKEKTRVVKPKAVGEISLIVNGRVRTLTLDVRVTLLDALRDRLNLTGTKKGCDQGTCGACTVLLNGRRILSCLTLAAMHDGAAIATIEGFSEVGDESLHPLQAAFIEHDAVQCGICIPGMLMSLKALLDETLAIGEDDVREAVGGNLCRCGTYPNTVKAALAAARTLRERTAAGAR
jgi:xanthine dehydrogenase YagT iron-sulfur-binding subunit